MDNYTEYCRDHSDKIKKVPYWDPTAHNDKDESASIKTRVIDVKTSIKNSILLTIEHEHPIGDISVQISEGDIVNFKVVNTYCDTNVLSNNNNMNYSFLDTIIGEVVQIKRVRVSQEDRITFVIKRTNIYGHITSADPSEVEVFSENIRFASIIKRGNNDSMYQIYCNLRPNSIEQINFAMAVVNVIGLGSHYTYSTTLKYDIDTTKNIPDYKVYSETYFEIPRTLASDVYLVKIKLISCVNDSISEKISEIGRIFVDVENGLFIPYTRMTDKVINKYYYITGIKPLSTCEPYHDNYSNNYYDTICISTADDEFISTDSKRFSYFEVENALVNKQFQIPPITNNSNIIFYNIPYNVNFKFCPMLKIATSDSEELTLSSAGHVHTALFNAVRYKQSGFIKNHGNPKILTLFLDLSKFIDDKYVLIDIEIKEIKYRDIYLSTLNTVVRQKLQYDSSDHYFKYGVIIPYVNRDTVYHVKLKRYVAPSLELTDVIEYDLDMSSNYMTNLIQTSDVKLAGITQVIPIDIPHNEYIRKFPFSVFNHNAYAVKSKAREIETEKVVFVKMYIDIDIEANDLLVNDVLFITNGNHRIIGVDENGTKYSFTLTMTNGEHNFNKSVEFERLDNSHTIQNIRSILEISFAFPDNKDFQYCTLNCTRIPTSTTVFVSENGSKYPHQYQFNGYMNTTNNKSSIFTDTVDISTLLDDTDPYESEVEGIEIEYLFHNIHTSENIYDTVTLSKEYISKIQSVTDISKNKRSYPCIITLGNDFSKYNKAFDELCDKYEFLNSSNIFDYVFDVDNNISKDENNTETDIPDEGNTEIEVDPNPDDTGSETDTPDAGDESETTPDEGNTETEVDPNHDDSETDTTDTGDESETTPDEENTETGIESGKDTPSDEENTETVPGEDIESGGSVVDTPSDSSTTDDSSVTTDTSET